MKTKTAKQKTANPRLQTTLAVFSYSCGVQNDNPKAQGQPRAISTIAPTNTKVTRNQWRSYAANRSANVSLLMLTCQIT
jgi:hypothetical protein